MNLEDTLTISEKQIDYLINILFLVVGGYALIESLSFSRSAQLWPRNVSIFLLIAGAILLARSYLPAALEPLVRDEALFGGDDDDPGTSDSELPDSDETPDLSDSETPDADDEEVVEDKNVGRYPIDNSVFTAIAMFGYIIFGWAFGLLWATPIFIAFYCWWFQKPWYLTGLLAAVGFITGYAFYDILYLPIDAGVITEMILE